MTHPNERAPGDFIKEELERRGWTQTDLARILGRPFPTINGIIQGKHAIMPEMALALGEAFGTGPEVWMQREAAYRLALAKATDTTVTGPVSKRARLYGLAPVKELEKRGWIRQTETDEDLEKELCRFFGVPSLDIEAAIGALPRKSVVGEPLNPAQRAWCVRAKNLASSMPVKPFTPEAVEKGIAKLRRLAAYPEETRKVSRVLADMGIRLVIVEPLPKTRIDGAALWLDEKSPVIVLSMRYDRIDSVWHTLGHEISHVKHRDSPVLDIDIVGENRPAPAAQSAVELRADRDAAAMWIDSKELDDFIVRVGPLYSKARINQFANRIRVHPGIIVGQLQFRGEIGYSANREMLVKVRDVVLSEALVDGWGHTTGERQ